MELEQQVVSLDLAKRLKELGVKQESYWYWIPSRSSGNLIHLTSEVRGFEKETVSAFTGAELGDMLPIVVGGKRLHYWKFPGKHSVEYLSVVMDNDKIHVDANTEADARAKMLVYILDNNLF